MSRTRVKLLFVVILAVVLTFAVLSACDKSGACYDDGGVYVVGGGGQTVQPPAETKSYTVMVNGGKIISVGENAVDPPKISGTFLEGTRIGVSADEKSGYRFVKWTKDGTDYSNDGVIYIDVFSDGAYTAVFSKTFVISLEANGQNLAPVSVIAGQKKVALPVPEKLHHDFTGWFDIGGAQFTQKNGIIETFSLESDIKLYAQFIEKQMFNVEREFRTDAEGLFYEVKITAVTDGIALAAEFYHRDEVITIEAPRQNDRLFFEWRGGELSDIERENAAFSYTFTPQSGECFTARYVDAFTIKTGGRPGGGDYPSGSTVEISLGILPIGQRFVKWQVKSGGVFIDLDASYNVELIYGGGEIVDARFTIQPAESMEFRAVFTPILYTVAYFVDYADNNGYVAYGTAASYYYGDTIVLPAEPTKQYHLFSGWVDAPVNLLMPAENTAIHGRFTIIRFTVEVESGYGGNVYSFGSTATISPLVIVGKSFSHWDDLNSNTSLAAGLDVYSFFVDKDYRFAARYTDNVYTVTYIITVTGTDRGGIDATVVTSWNASSNGGKIAGVYKVVERKYGELLPAQDRLTVTHYKSSGWSSQPITMPDADVTVTCDFAIDIHNVTLRNGKYDGKTAFSVEYGTQVTVVADTVIGKYFSQWRLGSQKRWDEEIYPFTVVSDLNDLTAVLENTIYNLTYYIKVLDGVNDANVVTIDVDGVPTRVKIYGSREPMKYWTTAAGGGEVRTTLQLKGAPAATESMAKTYCGDLWPHYEFSVWTGMPSQNLAPDGDLNIVGSYVKKKYEIRDIVRGRITKVDSDAVDLKSGKWDYGTSVTIVAELETGKCFSYWRNVAVPQGATVGADGEYTFVLDQNYISPLITAEVADIIYHIYYYSVGVLVEDAGNVWRVTGTSTLRKTENRIYREALNLSSAESVVTTYDLQYYNFDCWYLSDNPADLETPPLFTPASDVSVYGFYSPKANTLKLARAKILTVNGIVPSPAMENPEVHGMDFTLAYGDSVVIEPFEMKGYEFDSWRVYGSNDWINPNPPKIFTFTLSANRGIIAAYNPIKYTVAVAGGTIYSPQIVTSGAFDYMTDVYIRADVPNIGEKFSHWVVRIGGIDVDNYVLTSTFKHTVEDAVTFTAVFAPIDYTVEFVLNGGGYNTHLLSSETLTSVRHGDTVYFPTLSSLAVPLWWEFDSWDSVAMTQIGGTHFTFDASKLLGTSLTLRVSGAYKLKVYTVRTANYGLVHITGISGTASSYSVSYGAEITLTAQVRNGRTFDYWTNAHGETVSTLAAYTFILDGTFFATAADELLVNDRLNFTPNYHKTPFYIYYYTVKDGVRSPYRSGEETAYYYDDELGYGDTVYSWAAPTAKYDYYVFTGWRGIPSKMPYEDVTVLGTYEYIFDYEEVDGGVEIFANARITVSTYPKVIEFIPVIYGGFTVVSIRTQGFKDLGLTSVTIPNSMSSVKIDAGAFAGNPLTFISVPSISGRIGDDFGTSALRTVIITNQTDVPATAFMNIATLIKVVIGYAVIPNVNGLFLNVGTIGSNAFSGTGFTSVTIDAYSQIGSGAFADMASLTTVNYNVSVAGAIDASGIFANSGASTLTVVLDASVTAIPAYLFKNSKVTSVSLTNVTEIGTQAFYGTKLTGLSLHQNITEVCDGAFANITTLNTLDFAVFAQNAIKSGVFAGTGASGFTVNFLANVTAIPAELFLNNTAIESVTFVGTNLTSIGARAFDGAAALISVTIPANVSSIGVNAFARCTALSSVVFAGNLTTVFASGTDAVFYGSGNNTTAAADLSAYAEVPAHILESFTRLKTAVLYADTISIGTEAFKNCAALINLGVLAGGGLTYAVPITVEYVAAAAFSNVGVPAFTLRFQAQEASSGAWHEQWLLGYADPSTRIEWGVDNESFIGDDGTYYYTVTYVATAQSTYVTGYTVTGRVDNEPLDNYTYSVTLSNPLCGLSVPDIVSIGAAFCGDANLISVTLPTTVQSLGAGAFKNCTALVSVNASGVKQFAEDTFFGCESLESVIVSNASGSAYTTVDGVIFTDGGATLILYPSARAGTIYIIGENVTKIAPYAFMNARGISELQILGTIVDYGENCFMNMSGVRKLVIGASVTSLPRYVFDVFTLVEIIEIHAESMTADFAFSSVGADGAGISVTIKSEVRTFSANVFNDNAKVNTLTVENGVVTIGESAFEGTFVAALNLPASVITVGASAFKNTAVTSLTFAVGSGLTHIGADAFFRDSALSTLSLSSLTLPNGITHIDENAFRNRVGNITTLTIPSSVVSIGSFAFGGMADLTALNYNVVDIAYFGARAFDGMGLNAVSVMTVTIAANVTRIPNGFVADTKVFNVELSGNTVLRNVGESAFSGLNYITSIALPNSVLSIGANAFKNCAALESVGTIPQITRYEASVFEGCSSLEISVNANAVHIGARAFYGCTQMTAILLPATLAALGNEAFANCTAVEEITVNSALENIVCQNAFSNVGTAVADGVTLNLIGALIIPDGMFKGTIAPKLTEIVWGASGLLKEIGAEAFFDSAYLAEIILPDGLEIIGRKAFEVSLGRQSEVVTVTIPTSVVSIGESAFAGLTKVETLNFNAGSAVTHSSYTVGEMTFSGSNPFYRMGTYAGVTEDDGEGNDVVVIPPAAGVTLNIGALVDVLPRGLFANASSKLTTVDLSFAAAFDGKLTESVFSGAANLTTVKGYDRVLEVADNAFSNCVSLTEAIDCFNEEISLTEGLTYIGFYAFASVPLTEIVLGQDLTFVGGEAFANCSAVTIIRLNAVELSDFVSENTFLGIDDILLYIAPTVTRIPSYFMGAKTIRHNDGAETIDLTNVAYVGKSAFKGATFVDGIDLSFEYLVEWEYVVPAGPNPKPYWDAHLIDIVIDDEAFRNTTGITRLSIMRWDGTEKGAYAFAGSDIKEIIVSVPPPSQVRHEVVNNVGRDLPFYQDVRFPAYAFYGCTALTAVKYARIEILENMNIQRGGGTGVEEEGVYVVKQVFEQATWSPKESLWNIADLSFGRSSFEGCTNFTGVERGYDESILLTEDTYEFTEEIVSERTDWVYFRLVDDESKPFALPAQPYTFVRSSTANRNETVEQARDRYIWYDLFIASDNRENWKVRVFDVGDAAFKGCAKLTKMTAPINSVGAEAFRGCSALLNLRGDPAAASYWQPVVVEYWQFVGNNAFWGSGLGGLIVRGVGDLGENAFAKDAKDSVLDNAQTIMVWAMKIGDNAFKGYSGRIELPEDCLLTEIGNNAFGSATFVNSVINLGAEFEFDEEAEEYYLVPSKDNPLRSVGANAFLRYTGTINIFNSDLVFVGANAFNNNMTLRGEIVLNPITYDDIRESSFNINANAEINVYIYPRAILTDLWAEPIGDTRKLLNSHTNVFFWQNDEWVQYYENGQQVAWL